MSDPTPATSANHLATLALGAVLLAGTARCKETPSAVEQSPPASASASVAVSSSPPPRTVPILKAAEFARDEKLEGLFPVEGGLLVTSKTKVGRIEGLGSPEPKPGVAWIGSIPALYPAFGPNRIVSAHGRLPDIVGVVHQNENGRIPAPTYVPFIGKGESYTVAGGGGWGHITGVAVFGESVVLSVNSHLMPSRLLAVRGPKLPRFVTKAADYGCTNKEVGAEVDGLKRGAVSPYAFGGSDGGTLVVVGELCGDRGPTAEVWDVGQERSRIVPLEKYWRDISYSSRVLSGKGDQLWVYSDRWSPVLRYEKGAFTPEPLLERPIHTIFVSPDQVLHASDGSMIYRRGNDGWVPAARLEKPSEFTALALDSLGTFWGASGGVFRLLPTGKRSEGKDECLTWFVDLYAVSYQNQKTYTYPATRQALSSFPEVADIELVEHPRQGFSRRLGITVKSREQAKAVAAHVRKTMEGENPQVFCYAPQDARKIAIVQSPDAGREGTHGHQ